MIHLRVIAPPPLADAAHRLLCEHASALNVVRLSGVAQRPDGDLILCDVASEDAIPAAANVGVATAYADWSEVGGAAAQLAVNVACIIAAVLATLSL